MLFRFIQRPGVDDKHLIILGQGKHNLQPSAAGSSTHRSVLAAIGLPIFSAANNVFAFRNAHAMFGCMVQVPLHPPENILPHFNELYTPNRVM
jgi:hypothetical protein